MSWRSKGKVSHEVMKLNAGLPAQLSAWIVYQVSTVGQPLNDATAEVLGTKLNFVHFAV